MPEKQTTRAARDKPGRAFTTAGLKTLFAFICNPQLAAAPYREIAQAAGVALGALPAVLNSLQQTGYLQAAGRKRKLIAIDLVPFGQVETAARQIVWPPTGDVVMDAFGFREALASTEEVILPGNVRILSNYSPSVC